MRLSQITPVLFLTLVPSEAWAQERILVQDSTLNNLQHGAGVQTVPPGTLGNVRKVGTGPRVMLLIPGLGFGDDVWAEFMDRHKAEYTMYAITLPGFGDTPPLAMPAEGSRYLDTPWTKSALQGIVALLDRERISKVTVVAHWALASQIALRLALDHSERVESVVLVGGVLKAYYSNPPGMEKWTPVQRAGWSDGMGQRWFKTVTRKTWDDNNYMSFDYAINPRRASYLWREAQRPTLPVWIRYLLEFYAVDLTPELKDLKVPTLVVQPGFADPGFYVEPGYDYMRNLCLDSWKGAAELSSNLRFVTIPQSRLFVMYDQPEKLDQVMGEFLRQ